MLSQALSRAHRYPFPPLASLTADLLDCQRSLSTAPRMPYVDDAVEDAIDVKIGLADARRSYPCSYLRACLHRRTRKSFGGAHQLVICWHVVWPRDALDVLEEAACASGYGQIVTRGMETH